MNIAQIPEFKSGLLKTTKSRCLYCKQLCDADVMKIIRDGREQVIMVKHCENKECATYKKDHEIVLARDARFYHIAKGSPLNRSEGCGCGPSCCSPASGKRIGYLGTNALDEAKKGIIEKLATCVALIEIFDECNLTCPTCFADSPFQDRKSHGNPHSFEKLTNRIQGVIDRKGPIEILQFSGGEPTLHPEFYRLVEWVRQNPKIDYLLINTNGLRFAGDRTFVERMGELRKKYDNMRIYLQFDGVQEEGQCELRGVDLRKMREKAIANCETIGMPVTLAVTVIRDTLPFMYKTVEYALSHEIIRDISFQPVFLSGRALPFEQFTQPISVGEILLALNEQSAGEISLDDFTPLPCGDPNCATIGWRARLGGMHFSPSKFGVSIPKLQKQLPDRINYDMEDLAKCGCDGTALGDLIKKFAAKESNAFAIFIKPFMDERTWDEDRIDRCCTHVIRSDGKLDSFCRYYFNQAHKMPTAVEP